MQSRGSELGSVGLAETKVFFCLALSFFQSADIFGFWRSVRHRRPFADYRPIIGRYSPDSRPTTYASEPLKRGRRSGNHQATVARVTADDILSADCRQIVA